MVQWIKSGILQLPQARLNKPQALTKKATKSIRLTRRFKFRMTSSAHCSFHCIKLDRLRMKKLAAIIETNQAKSRVSKLLVECHKINCYIKVNLVCRETVWSQLHLHLGTIQHSIPEVLRLDCTAFKYVGRMGSWWSLTRYRSYRSFLAEISRSLFLQWASQSLRILNRIWIDH